MNSGKQMSRMIAPQVLEALRAFDSPTLSNAIEAFHVRDRCEGYASMEIRCQFPDLDPVIGYAVTAAADGTSPGTGKPNRLPDLLDLVAASPKPSIVVLHQVGPDPMRSCFTGDLICSAYRRLGAVGVVTDAGVRDLSGIRSRTPGFQVFSPGSISSHGNVTFVEIDVPVSVGGLLIEPGDLLHGDENGVLKIPIEIAESVLEEARAVRKKEQALLDYLEEEESISLSELKRRFLD
jgi:regulator of RNase E activity RraA